MTKNKYIPGQDFFRIGRVRISVDVCNLYVTESANLGTCS